MIFISGTGLKMSCDLKNADAEKPSTGSFWNKDLLLNKMFRKVFTVGILIPAIVVILVSASAIFGIPATAAYFVLMLLGFKLYDLYEAKKANDLQREWRAGMEQAGWQQVSKNLWEISYWDYYHERNVTHRYFTDGPISQRLTVPRQTRKRHPSYIVHKRRIRRRRVPLTRKE